MKYHYYVSFYLPRQSRITTPVRFETDRFAAFQKQLDRCNHFGYEILSAYIVGEREILDISEEVLS